MYDLLKGYIALIEQQRQLLLIQNVPLVLAVVGETSCTPCSSQSDV